MECPFRGLRSDRRSTSSEDLVGVSHAVDVVSSLRTRVPSSSVAALLVFAAPSMTFAVASGAFEVFRGLIAVL
jgi:hypothetical protein